VDISNAYTREEQSSRRFTIETCNERGLLNSARSTGRRTATAEVEAISGCVCKSPQQAMQEILQSDAGQLVDRTRWTEQILERRDSTSSYTNPTYIENNQQDHGREDKRCYNCTPLDLPVMVARPPETDSQDDCFGKLQTKLDNWRQNEEKITAFTTRRFDDSIIQGQKGEYLYFKILEERGLARKSINQIIQNWHTCWGRHRQRLGQFQKYWNSLNTNQSEIKTLKDPQMELVNYISFLRSNKATPNNVYESRTAVGMLFKAAGHLQDQINGILLKQIMKQIQAETRKVFMEESIWDLNDLLKVIEIEATHLTEITESKFMGCVMSSIMAFSTLRLSEIVRSSVNKLSNNEWQLSTSIWKGNEITSNNYFSQNEESKSITYVLVGIMTIATAEQASKAVHCIMKLAGIDNSYSVTSIRSASITKAIAQGATMEEINRMSRHKDGPKTVQVFYDKNLNDEVRERLGSFQ
ncbi:MAG: hypothetical protein EZS28_024250, partial [Streblomastix strix]